MEEERRRRIQVLLWAYAYEYRNDPLVSDEMFDKTCGLIDLKIDTDNKIMDKWFRKNFVPYTGQWIHKLTLKERNKIMKIYESIRRKV